MSRGGRRSGWRVAADGADIAIERVDAHADGDPLLVVRELTTTFDTPEGSIKAVDGVSFELRQG